MQLIVLNRVAKKCAIHLLTSALLFAMAMAQVNNSYADPGENQAQFTERSLKGNYAFSLNGIAHNVFDGSIIHATAVGRLTFNGKGIITDSVRTLNTSGTIQKEIFSGTYTVNPDGTGNLKIQASVVLPDGSTIPSSIETGDFVISRSPQQIQLIGTNITGPNGEDLGLRLVTHGMAHKQ